MKEFKLINKEVAEYFRTARERYRIMLRRDNDERSPWSTDPIFRNWFFCNVFREDDKVTRWIKKHIREPHRNDPCVFWMMVAARLFNKISTLEILVNAGLFKDGDSWDRSQAEALLENVKPLTGAAYVICTPSGVGMNKLQGCLKLIADARVDNFRRTQFITPGATPQEDVWNMILEADCFGPFMAYEVVTDLTHTYLLENAPDKMTWANPGPGACLGLSRLVGETVSYGSKAARDGAISCMIKLLERCRTEECHWPAHWPAWDMRTVEHWLCEHSKWCRVRFDGSRMKRKYLPKS